MSDQPTWRGEAQCTARSSRSGEQCRRAPVKGATVCATHGGRAPQVKAAAAVRAAEQVTQEKSLAAVSQWVEGTIPDDPSEVLLRAVHVTWWQAAAHRQQLAQAAVGGKNPYVRLDKAGREYPSALAVLEQTERRMAADFAAKAVGADLAGRHLRLQERYADSMEELVVRLVRGLGRDPEEPEVRALIRSELQSLIEAGAA